MKERLLPALLLAYCSFLIIYNSLGHPLALDSFWHLQTGADLITKGWSPFVDHYSFSYEGESISFNPYPFQVLLYFFCRIFGTLLGFQLFKVFAWLLPLLFLFIALYRRSAGFWAYLFFLPLVTGFFLYRNVVRPELLSFSFVFVCLVLVLRARAELTVRNGGALALLLILWANYHTSSVFGYMIIGLFYVEMGLNLLIARTRDIKVWARWFLLGMLALFVGFLNPTFYHPLLSAIGFPAEWHQYIGEYAAMDISGLPQFIVFFWFLLPGFALVLGIRRHYAFAALLVFLCYMGTQNNRFISITAFIALAMAALLHIEMLELRPRLNKVLLGVGIVLYVAMLGLVGKESWQHVFGQEIAHEFWSSRYPVDVTEQMRADGAQGRVFSTYGLGGYLIHRLSPDVKVFIDGRTHILYPLEHMEEFVAAAKSSQALSQLAESKGINHIVLPSTNAYLSLAKGLKDFQMSFIGESFFLYSRDKGRFHVSGQLMLQPHCWDVRLLPELNREFEQGYDLLPDKSPLKPMLEMVGAYAKSSDPSLFLKNPRYQKSEFDIVKRLAAFMAIDLHRYQMAVSYLGSIKEMKVDDFLVAAILFTEMQSEAMADQVLVTAWSKKERFNDQQKKILLAVLERITQKIPEPTFPAEDWSVLRKEQSGPLPNLMDFARGGDCNLLPH